MLDIVIQGGMWNTTTSTAKYYSTLPFVNKVIISTWDTDDVESIDNSKIFIIKSKKPDSSDLGNMNLQIVSSFEGIKATTSEMVVKVRSDQTININSMNMLFNFVNKNINDTELVYSDGIKRKGNIFVIGMNNRHPFHPQDHLFWGYRDDIYRLFDIPLKPEKMKIESNDFKQYMRPNIYLGAMYFRQIYEEVDLYLQNFKEYLVDNSIKPDARIFSEKVRDKVFKVIPKIDLVWTKYNWNSYPYNWYPSEGEYYYEDLYGPYED